MVVQEWIDNWVTVDEKLAFSVLAGKLVLDVSCRCAEISTALASVIDE